MPTLPHSKRKEFDQLIHDEFETCLNRRSAIVEKTRSYFERDKEELIQKVRGVFRAKIELDMKPDIRQEASVVFEFWFSQLLLNQIDPTWNTEK